MGIKGKQEKKEIIFNPLEPEHKQDQFPFNSLIILTSLSGQV